MNYYLVFSFRILVLDCPEILGEKNLSFNIELTQHNLFWCCIHMHHLSDRDIDCKYFVVKQAKTI